MLETDSELGVSTVLGTFERERDGDRCFELLGRLEGDGGWRIL